MSQLYSDGVYASGISGIPTSGSLISVSHFYGKNKYFTKWLSSNFSVTPAYGGNGYAYAGFEGNTFSSTSEGTSFTITIPKTANGVRVILQAAGGASPQNDGDPASSANSGATAVFDIASSMTGTYTVLLGSAGKTHDGNYINVNPRSISLVSNPLGAYAVSPGQASYAGNGAFDSCFIRSSDNVIFGYAEGGGSSINYDSPNTNPSRPYVNTSYVTSVATYNGPTSTGRGTHPTDDNYPAWNFNSYSDLATCYGLTSNLAANKYGKGGLEPPNSGAGYNGYRGFLWIYIK